MKAITICQPWADAIMCGVKEYETRSWRTLYRGPIAIHAGKRMFSEIDRIAFHPVVYLVSKALRDRPERMAQRGAIIAVAKLVACVPTGPCGPAGPLIVAANERVCGDFSEGRWAWKMEDVWPIWPGIGCDGHQGLWTLPPNIEASVRKEIDAAIRKRTR